MIDILITFSLLASAITVNKILLFSISPELLVTLRMLLAGALLMGLNLFSSYGKRSYVSYNKFLSNLKTIILIALSTTFINSLLKAYALKYMSSSKAAFFGTLDPFATAIFAYFIFNERLTLQKVMGILCACLGSFILLSDRFSLDEHYKAFAFISYPEIAALGAVFISRFGWVLAQKLLKQHTYSPQEINAQTMLLGGMLSLAFMVGTQDFCLDSGNYYKIFNLWSWPLTAMLAYTVLVGNVVAYNLYGHMLKKYSATYISLMGFSVPLFVAVYGKLFLKEPLSINFLSALLITFLGFILFYLEEKTNKS